MKKLLYLFCFLATRLLAQEVPVLGPSDLLNKNAYYVLATDTAFGDISSYLDAEEKQNWDFIGLKALKQDTVKTSVKYGKEESQIMLLSHIPGEFSELTKNTSGIFITGQKIMLNDAQVTLHYKKPEKLYAFPLKLHASKTDTAFITTTFKSTIDWADSARIDMVNIRKDSIDGAGEVILPHGSYNSLRRKILEDNTHYISVLKNGIWKAYDTLRNLNTSYQWLGQNADYPLITITGNPEKPSIRFLSATFEHHLKLREKENPISIYPTPTHGPVTISVGEVSGKISYYLIDQDGNRFQHKNKTIEKHQTFTEDFSALPAGKYSLIFITGQSQQYSINVVLI